MTQMLVGDFVYVDTADDRVHVDVYYPKINKINTVQVCLVDVRAADDVRIYFDFDLNQWIVQQEFDNGWKDVARLPATRREQT